jgi:hypothetical protein
MGEMMRKVALLAASALLVPGVAFADGEETTMSPHFLGVSAGWTTIEMPDHGNGAFQLDFGGGVQPLVEQADVDGVTYSIGIGKDLSSGWRVGAGARFFDGDGSSSRTFAIPNATSFRRGAINGGGVVVGAWGGVGSAVQQLDVHVNDYAIGAAVGHGLGDMLHADLIVSYGARESEYRNRVDELNFTELYITNTTFTENTVEIAGRMSAMVPLSADFSFGVGGSAGWALRNIDMNASQLYQNGALTTSSIGVDEDTDGFVGRVDASFNYALARSTMIGLTANYVYDDLVPVYVAPNYVAGTAATFTTEGHSSMTYGLRVVGRF